MADAKLSALSAISAVALDDLFYVVDDPAGTPASTKATTQQLQAAMGLVHTAGSDADTTMVVGAMYVVDMSAWATADRTYTLPATAAVGDRVGIMITAGDASHELIIQANTGDTLNGVTAAEWSRLFNTGEVVIMRCVTANAAWMVEYDGRKSAAVIVTNDGSTAQTINASTFTKVAAALTTVEENTATEWDTSGKTYTPRRPGRYWIGGGVSLALVTTNATVIVLLYKNGSEHRMLFRGYSSDAATATNQVSGSALVEANGTTDYFELYAYHSSSAAKDTETVAGRTFFNGEWRRD